MEPLALETHKLTVRSRLDTLGKITKLIAYVSAILKQLLLCIMMIGKFGLVNF